MDEIADSFELSASCIDLIEFFLHWKSMIHVHVPMQLATGTRTDLCVFKLPDNEEERPIRKLLNNSRGFQLLVQDSKFPGVAISVDGKVEPGVTTSDFQGICLESN